MSTGHSLATFYGWRVVAAVFVLATFGWGLGFYGLPVYLQTVRETRGWSLALISTAVTVHFLFGALVVANLPKLYQTFGVSAVTKAGCVALAVGILGWAAAQEPWQLFLATLSSGGGWVTMSAAAVNAIISPWFVQSRAAALASAYNGSSVGGVIFSPLWVGAIGLLGFPGAALAIGFAMIATTWVLANRYYSKTPEQMGLVPDDGTFLSTAVSVTSPLAVPLPGNQLWLNWRFLTLATGMALGLFAQVGLFAHLFSLLVPALGAQLAGIAASAATASAVVGRTLFGWLMPIGADRRLFACASYLVQIAGTLAFLLAAGNYAPMLLLGVVLFGFGIGNAISLPPLIAQVEFVKNDVSRVVPLIVAISQGTYAFAPATFGVIREFTPQSGTMAAGSAPYLFIAAAVIQGAAIAAFMLGRFRFYEPGQKFTEHTDRVSDDCNGSFASSSRCP
jgi:MFS family permease